MNCYSGFLQCTGDRPIADRNNDDGVAASARVSPYYDMAVLIAVWTCSSVALAQQNTGTFEISTGAIDSPISQIEGVLIDPRWSPAFDFQYHSGNYFIDSENGVGVAFLRDRPVRIGALIGYQYGRRAHADSQYRGMGDVDGSMAPAVFIEWEPVRDALDIYLNASKAVSSSTGWLYKLEFSGGLPLNSKINGYVDIIANACDKSYAQSYYGVTRAQAVTSNYPLYSPAGGWSAINTALGIEYRYSKIFSVNAQIGQLRYLDIAESGPLIDKKTFLTAGFFASYHY